MTSAPSSSAATTRASASSAASGARACPSCVVDDEHSIARFSRYATQLGRRRRPRRRAAAVDDLLATRHAARARRLGAVPDARRDGRGDLRATASVLVEQFPRADARWETIQWAWDKRNTYALAERAGHPDAAHLAAGRRRRSWTRSTVEPPLAIKPAIKEHFFYATKAKAWRADTREELRELFDARARRIVGPGEVMVQELIPGDGEQQFAYCAFYQGRRAARHDGRPPARGSIRRSSAAPARSSRPSSCRSSRRCPSGSSAPSTTTASSSSSTSSTRATGSSSCSTSTPAPGATTRSRRRRRRLPVPPLPPISSGEAVEPRRGRAGVRWVRLVTDLPTGDRRDRRRAARTGASTCGRCGARTSRPSSAARTRCPAWWSLLCLPYLSVKRGF